MKESPDGACLCIWSGWASSGRDTLEWSRGEQDMLEPREMGSVSIFGTCTFGGHRWSAEGSILPPELHIYGPGLREAEGGDPVGAGGLVWADELFSDLVNPEVISKGDTSCLFGEQWLQCHRHEVSVAHLTQNHTGKGLLRNSVAPQASQLVLRRDGANLSSCPLWGPSAITVDIAWPYSPGSPPVLTLKIQGRSFRVYQCCCAFRVALPKLSCCVENTAHFIYQKINGSFWFFFSGHLFTYCLTINEK